MIGPWWVWVPAALVAAVFLGVIALAMCASGAAEDEWTEQQLRDLEE